MNRNHLNFTSRSFDRLKFYKSIIQARILRIQKLSAPACWYKQKTSQIFINEAEPDEPGNLLQARQRKQENYESGHQG